MSTPATCQGGTRELDAQRGDGRLPHPEPRTYSVGLLLTTQGGREVRKRVHVQARSPQGARDAARRRCPGWRPYNPRPV